MYGGSAHSGHSGYHGGGYQPYNPALAAHEGLGWARDALPDARVPAAALTAEQAEQFKAQLGQLSVREFHEIYQTMHSEVPTAIAHYAPLGTLGGALGGPADTSMPNSANFLRPIPDAIKNDQDPRGMSIAQLIESGTLTPGELMVLCDVMHNDQVQKMMESVNPAELAARGNFTINNYAIEKLQQRLFPDNPFALSDGDEKKEKEKQRLEDFAAACEDMNRTEAQKAWDDQPFHDFAGQRWTSKELLDFFKWTDDPSNLDMVDEDLLNTGNWPPSKIKSAREKYEERKRLEKKIRNGTATDEDKKRAKVLDQDEDLKNYNKKAQERYLAMKATTSQNYRVNINNSRLLKGSITDDEELALLRALHHNSHEISTDRRKTRTTAETHTDISKPTTSQEGPPTNPDSKAMGTEQPDTKASTTTLERSDTALKRGF